MSIKKHIYLISATIGLGIASTLILYTISEGKTHSQSSYIRLMPPHMIDFQSKLDLKFNSYYIIKSSDQTTYLGNITSPKHILLLNNTTLDTQHIYIKIPEKDYTPTAETIVKIDSDNFYIGDGSSRKIIKGNIRDWTSKSTIHTEIPFSKFEIIDKNTLAITTTDPNTGNYEIARIEQSSKNKTTIFNQIIEKQVDGIFCSDGILQYNSGVKKLVYTYYYRNQFICVDTSFVIKYRGITIDTISKAKIKISKIESNNTITLSERPAMVNNKITTYDKWLFINSPMLAKNESSTSHRLSSTIDVYDINNGKYMSSFYIPDYEENKMVDFTVSSSGLYVLYDHTLITYSMNWTFLN